MDTTKSIPRVSVIMPLYNAEAYVAEAIGSVISQTVTDWELLVIDDCATDGSYEAALAAAGKDPRIQILRNEKNSGVARTRNRGIELARGEYIALLDSDDVWHPEKLERQLELMEEKNAQLCYASAHIIGADSEEVRPDYLVPPQVSYEELLKENVIQCSSIVVVAEYIKNHMFNTDFYHEDYVFGLELLRSGCLAVGCTEPLLSWRYVENSRSFNKWKSAKNRWKIYRDYLHLPLGKTLYVFACYATAGFNKYFSKAKSN